jgi:hypothetical protein
VFAHRTACPDVDFANLNQRGNRQFSEGLSRDISFGERIQLWPAWLRSSDSQSVDFPRHVRASSNRDAYGSSQSSAYTSWVPALRSMIGESSGATANQDP